MRVAGFMHGVEYPPMHGLEAIAQVGDGTADDDRHRVIEIGCLHLVGDGNAGPVVRRALWHHFVSVFRGLRVVAHLAARPVSEGLYFVVWLYQRLDMGCNACPAAAVAAKE